MLGVIHYYPNYCYQDDGFGNLMWVDDAETFKTNFSKYLQE